MCAASWVCVCNIISKCVCNISYKFVCNFTYACVCSFSNECACVWVLFARLLHFLTAFLVLLLNLSSFFAVFPSRFPDFCICAHFYSSKAPPAVTAAGGWGERHRHPNLVATHGQLPIMLPLFVFASASASASASAAFLPRFASAFAACFRIRNVSLPCLQFLHDRCRFPLLACVCISSRQENAYATSIAHK